MSAFTVLTYATHAQGTYEELVRAVPHIRTGGWGEEWKGFMQKFQFVFDFAQKCDAQHIIIFVDGFDTRVRLPPAEAVRRFLQMGTPFLVSALGVEMQLPALLSRTIFQCTDAECANTGLYMGYAYAVAQVLGTALREEERALMDDQRAFELARARLPRELIRVDSDCRVFHNLNLAERRNEDSHAVFIGSNATSAFESWKTGSWRVMHFSNVLAHQVVAALLVVVLATLWKRFSLPVLCCGDLVFPASLLVFIALVPSPSLAFSSGLFLFSLFAFVIAAVPPPCRADRC